jgi:hypothetical protein
MVFMLATRVLRGNSQSGNYIVPRAFQVAALEDEY